MSFVRRSRPPALRVDDAAVRRSARVQRRMPAYIAAVMSLASCPVAFADESGTPFWVSGQLASLAAVPSSPGWSVNLQGYGYRGTASSSQELSFGRRIDLGGVSRTPSFTVEPGYAWTETIFGGQPFFGVSWGLGGDYESTTASLMSGQVVSSKSDRLWAGTDLVPWASLAWSRGNDNWMAYATGNIPTGAYQASRLSNIGIGHGAIDFGGGYTYYDIQSGAEASAVIGVTFNWENTHTQYRNGIDSHLDWAVSRFVTPNWQLGIAGYVYYQLTGDSGSGAVLGPFKSRVAAIGPEIGYQFMVGGEQWYANLRGYAEFWAQNRFEGYAVFATLNIPLGTK